MSSSCEHDTSTTINTATINTATKYWLTLAGLVIVGLVSGVGAYVGTQFSTTKGGPSPAIELHAATASSNDSLSMATGLITQEVEGLWLLDHNSGQLQCWVMSPKTGNVAGIFSSNIANDLDGSKGTPKLVMTTGTFFFTGGTARNQQPANSICYVANTTSGVVAGYSVSVNRTVMNRGQTQGGTLTRVCTGKLNGPEPERDQ